VRRSLLGPHADAVLATDRGGVTDRLAAFADDPDALAACAVQVRRHVLTRHGRAARVDALVTRLGLDTPPPRRVGALLATRRPELLPAVTADLARQVGVDIELTVAVHGDAPVPDRCAMTPDAVVRIAADRPLGAVLNAALDRTHTPLLAKVDDDDRYGRHHLADLRLALDYSGADVVGRRRHAVLDAASGAVVLPDGPGEERWEDHLPGATMLAHGEVLRGLRWRHVPRGVDTELVRAVHLAGGSCYSSHRFGFVRNRHDDHTYAGRFTGRPVAGGIAAMLDV
jgi:hypothetical protein